MEGKKVYTSFGQALNEEDIRQLPFIDSGTFGSVYDYGDGKVIKLLNHPDFDSQIYKIGDGMAVSIKRNK